MNTIAVLTDFSEQTTHACFFALKLAVRLKADVQFFNVGVTEKKPEHSVIAAGDRLSIEPDDELFGTDFCRAVYADFEQRCFTGSFQPAVSCQTRRQDAPDVMMSIMESSNVCFIVIPLPAGQTMTSFGRSTAFKSLMKLATAPLLIVPESENNHYFEKAAFCTDHSQADVHHILTLVDLLKPLSTSIMLSHLADRNRNSTGGEELMKAVYKGTDYGRIYYRNITPANCNGSWKWLTNDKKCDLLVVTQMPDAEMDAFFNRGETMAATWHINIPLLVFPCWSE